MSFKRQTAKREGPAQLLDEIVYGSSLTVMEYKKKLGDILDAASDTMQRYRCSVALTFDPMEVYLSALPAEMRGYVRSGKARDDEMFNVDNQPDMLYRVARGSDIGHSFWLRTEFPVPVILGGSLKVYGDSLEPALDAALSAWLREVERVEFQVNQTLMLLQKVRDFANDNPVGGRSLIKLMPSLKPYASSDNVGAAKVQFRVKQAWDALVEKHASKAIMAAVEHMLAGALLLPDRDCPGWVTI